MNLQKGWLKENKYEVYNCFDMDGIRTVRAELIEYKRQSEEQSVKGRSRRGEINNSN